MNPAVKSFFALAVLMASATASSGADPAPEAYNARALAMGGATASIAGKTLSARSNPAALAPEKGFFAGGSYLTRGKTQLDAVAVTLVDNSSAPIAGAIHYLRTVTKGESEEVGLSLAAGTEGHYWGVTGRFAHTRVNRRADWDSAFIGDIGMLIVRDWGFSIGVVGRDLLDSSYEALERRVAVGASMNFDFGLMISADYVRYIDRGFDEGSSVHAGAEWRPSQTPWAVRAGYSRDSKDEENYYSAGLGWSNQRIEVDYAIRRNTSKSNDTIHVFGFSAPF